MPRAALDTDVFAHGWTPLRSRGACSHDPRVMASIPERIQARFVVGTHTPNGCDVIDRARVRLAFAALANQAFGPPSQRLLKYYGDRAGAHTYSMFG